jgi:hypothetical protein
MADLSQLQSTIVLFFGVVWVVAIGLIVWGISID